MLKGCDLGAALETVDFGGRSRKQPARLPCQEILI
jgi:hypothetical protein